jgi:Tol biopolymer transport system component
MRLRFAATITVPVLCGVLGTTLAAQRSASLFEPSVISTAAPEFAISFSPDGQEVYFNRATEDRSSFPIYVSHRAGGKWSAAEPVPFAAAGRNPDPFVTPNGQRIYFASTRPKQEGDTSTDMDIWYVERRGTRWSNPINPGAPVNSPGQDVFASATADGTLYFGSDRDGKGAIYRATRSGAGFRSAERLPDVINADGAGNPAISKDGRWLFFAGARPDTLGASDVYVSEWNGRDWSRPSNLGPAVNSQYSEFAPALSPDGKRLFFTSERPGIVPARAGTRPPGDIYSIDLNVLGIGG